MRCALNQAGAAVQEFIGSPFQRDASVWASVLVDENLTLATRCQQIEVIQNKPPALGLGQMG